jgi:hypothetical protein
MIKAVIPNVFPEDPICAFVLDYFVSDQIFWRHNGDFDQSVSVTFATPGRPKKRVEKYLKDLQKF